MGRGSDVTMTSYTWANFPWRFSLPCHWIPKAVVVHTPLWVSLSVPRVSKPKWGSTELWAHLTMHSGEFLVWLLKNMRSVCLCILSLLPRGAVLWEIRDLLPIFLSLGVIFVVLPKVLPKVTISALWHEALVFTGLSFPHVQCHGLTRMKSLGWNPQVHLISLLCPNPGLWQWLLIFPELSWMLMGEIICGMLSTTSIHCC